MGQKIVVMIPSHNEEGSIGRTLESVFAQSRQPDRVIVMCDNCTDRTAAVARDHGAAAWYSVNNQCKKAGAQNQALEAILPTLEEDDLVLSMDADVLLHPDYLKSAQEAFEDPKVGAVSSNHYVAPLKGRTPLQIMQKTEYARDARYMGRKRGKKGCMSGMATCFRASALKQIKEVYGYVYDTNNWTEDWKLTFALRKEGWKCIRPKTCLCTTEPVGTWKGLFVQRERWGRGYFQTLCDFKVCDVTIVPWMSMFWGIFQTIVWTLWTMVIAVSIAVTHTFVVPSWFYVIMSILLLERVVTARKAGIKSCVLALLYLPEVLYSWVLLVATYTGVFKHLFKVHGQWGDMRNANPQDT